MSWVTSWEDLPVFPIVPQGIPPVAEIPNPFGMTPQMEGATMMHEMFSSYVAAGFTRDEALRLLAYIMAAGRPDDTPDSTPGSA